MIKKGEISQSLVNIIIKIFTDNKQYVIKYFIEQSQ